MDDEIKELKSMLRSLVVSSPTQVDVRSLLRDYKNIVGVSFPLTKFGYRDPVAFLKERCSDCFLLDEFSPNPVLTLIVPETLKHIDQFVQKQKVSSTAKCRSKRRSIPESVVNPPKKDLIYKTFVKSTARIIEEAQKPEVKAPDIAYNNHDKKNVVDNKEPITSNDVKNFLNRRLPAYKHLNSFDEVPSEKEFTKSTSQDDDSGKQTLSSSSSTKALQFEELKAEIIELIDAAPEGIWCTDLIRLYRERYKRELNFSRFGYTSIISLVYVLEARVDIARPEPTGDWLLRARGHAPAPPPPRQPPRAPPRRPARPALADPDDALPGIDFEPDVFPADCMHFMESIPQQSLADIRRGDMLEVIVGEVYSPSHFWLIRLGDNYNIAMEDMMDDMTQYYNGEGRERALSRGAVRVGHYCSTLYENDWHRSLIVKILDSDTVKVRHVDYGTVDTVSVGALRPLRRAWAALPAQALRARLAGVRPPAAGRRWPHAAAQHFLRLVRDTRFVANVVAVDADERVLEALLIDTAGADDRSVGAELVRAGHADATAAAALRTAECYLYPRFEALESGDTPNYAEIHAYLRDGIALDCVDAYRRHVPCLPPDGPASPAAPATPAPAPPPDLATCIPLLLPPAPAAALVQADPTPPPSSSTSSSSPPPPTVPVAPAPLPLERGGGPAFGAAPFPGAGQWFGPYPVPGTVALSVAECQTYRLLAHVDPPAAHWYMAGALGRALGGPPLLPLPPPHFAPHLPYPPLGPPLGPPRPPPGFGG